MTASESAGPAWSADFLQQSTAAWTQYLELGKSLLAQLDLGSKVGGFDGLSSALSGWQQQLNASPFGRTAAESLYAAMSAPLPAVGPHALQNLALQRMQRLQARAAQLQVQLIVLLQASTNAAATKFVERARLIANKESSAHQPPPTLRALFDLWIDCAEDAYATCVHSDAFCRVQAELANSVNALKLAQREQFEQLARQLDLPTRTESDALIQRIRTLESQLDQAGPSPATAHARRKTRSAKRGKPKSRS
ncbi:MAG: hypothetical protein KDI32_12815 [Pseudomonadales bacterium]|nr:hypothetical protein [Pseudomonadales bacterium]